MYMYHDMYHVGTVVHHRSIKLKKAGPQTERAMRRRSRLWH